jgi:hypothetical protein
MAQRRTTSADRDRTNTAACIGRCRCGRASSATMAVVAIVTAAALLGCSSAAAVKTKSAPIVGVAGFHTYDWGTPAPVVIADEDRERDAAVLEYTIRDAIDRQLAAKGYRRVEGGTQPDFLVDFGVRLEEKSTDSFGQYIQYRDLGGKQGMGSAFVFGYEQGSLAIEVTNARTNQRAWTGSARAVLDDGQDVVKLDASVGRILADFPNAGGKPAQKVDLDSPGMFHPPVP